MLIDIAAVFLTSDRALYEKYYGKHPNPELAAKFTYALADVVGQSLKGKTMLAAPGCFATAAQLALWPLRNISNGTTSSGTTGSGTTGSGTTGVSLGRTGVSLGRTGVSPVIFAITGSSGAGVGLKPTVHHPARAHNLFAYSVLSHRHEAEILQRWHEWAPADRNEPRLMVHAGPFVRGIYLTLHARGEGLSAGIYHKAYVGRPFVKVLEQPPELTHVVGTNYAYIHAAATPDGKEIQVHVAIDNLVKGAGGQAVQAMNLALGLPETAGLVGGGIWPI